MGCAGEEQNVQWWQGGVAGAYFVYRLDLIFGARVCDGGSEQGELLVIHRRELWHAHPRSARSCL